MESPARVKLKPQKLPWWAFSAPEKEAPKDKSLEKRKLKLRILFPFKMNGSKYQFQLQVRLNKKEQKKGVEEPVQLKPQKISVSLKRTNPKISA